MLFLSLSKHCAVLVEQVVSGNFCIESHPAKILQGIKQQVRIYILNAAGRQANFTNHAVPFCSERLNIQKWFNIYIFNAGLALFLDHDFFLRQQLSKDLLCLDSRAVLR